jgi:diguanylate cyclase (GGDEF)-like protein
VANRVRFRERLKARLADPRGGQARCAIIYIDLDHFKPVNDALGHQAGDELLRAVTSRLGALLRGEDLLARRGGDEFVVLVDAVMSREDAEAIATRLCSVLAQPFSIAGQLVRISGSLGIALHPDDGIDDEALVARADRCMYLAKERGRNRWVSHDEASPAIA